MEKGRFPGGCDSHSRVQGEQRLENTFQMEFLWISSASSSGDLYPSVALVRAKLSKQLLCGEEFLTGCKPSGPKWEALRAHFLNQPRALSLLRAAWIVSEFEKLF